MKKCWANFWDITSQIFYFFCSNDKVKICQSKISEQFHCFNRITNFSILKVAANIVWFQGIYNSYWNGRISLTCQPIDYTIKTPQMNKLIFATYLYYSSKYVDLLDTVRTVLYHTRIMKYFHINFHRYFSFYEKSSTKLHFCMFIIMEEWYLLCIYFANFLQVNWLFKAIVIFDAPCEYFVTLIILNECDIKEWKKLQFSFSLSSFN